MVESAPAEVILKKFLFRCLSISINSKFTDLLIYRHLAMCTLTTLCRVQDGQDSDQDNQDSHQDGQSSFQDGQNSHDSYQDSQKSDYNG